MATVHRTGASIFTIVKGAPEVILPACSQTLDAAGKPEMLGEPARRDILEKVESMADDALRVIAIARKESAGIAEASDGFTFLGLAGMIDPPRDEAKAAVERCVAAGIRPVMRLPATIR